MLRLLTDPEIVCVLRKGLGEGNGRGFLTGQAAFPAAFDCEEVVLAPLWCPVQLVLWFCQVHLLKAQPLALGKNPMKCHSLKHFPPLPTLGLMQWRADFSFNSYFFLLTIRCRRICEKCRKVKEPSNPTAQEKPNSNILGKFYFHISSYVCKCV